MLRRTHCMWAGLVRVLIRIQSISRAGLRAAMAETKRRKKYFQASAGQLSGSSCKDKGPNPCKVFVANISYKVSGCIRLRVVRSSNCSTGFLLQVSERELKEFFSDFGPVKYCQIVKDHRKKWSRGYVSNLIVQVLNLQQFLSTSLH